MSGGATSRMQYGALPYRRRAGCLEIMLVTSRETGRWVIPKGWPIQGLKPHESAAREAMEEGGLVGQVSEQPIGSYRYEKSLADGATVECSVEIFGLDVKAQLPSWPEQQERQTRWFAPHEASTVVQESELGALIQTLAALLP